MELGQDGMRSELLAGHQFHRSADFTGDMRVHLRQLLESDSRVLYSELLGNAVRNVQCFIEDLRAELHCDPSNLGTSIQ